jgi:hypothetical protein
MIFDSYDDPESKTTFSEQGTGPCVAMIRSRETAAVAIGIIAKYGAGAKGLELMRKHIIGLDLAPERINRLRSYAVSAARPHGHGYRGDRPDHEQVPTWDFKGRCTYGEWRRANFLVMQAALTILLDVPLAGPSDAHQFCEIMQAWTGALPKSLQPIALQKVQSYVTSRITGQPFQFDETLIYQGERWLAYRKEDVLAVEPPPSSLTLGRDYVFQRVDDTHAIVGRLKGVSRTRFTIEHASGVLRLPRFAWNIRNRITARFAGRPLEHEQQQPTMKEAA